MAGVCPSGKSLFGSIGGCPPFGDARVRSTPASRKTKYGAANSSSQKPVFRPVLPRTSCDVSTISIFMFFLLLFVVRSPIDSDDITRSDQKSWRRTIRRWYRRYLGIDRRQLRQKRKEPILRLKWYPQSIFNPLPVLPASSRLGQEIS